MPKHDATDQIFRQGQTKIGVRASLLEGWTGPLISTQLAEHFPLVLLRANATGNASSASLNSRYMQVRGVAEPIHIYEVIGPGPLRTHFELSAQRGLTKFVGRERELKQIQHALELAMTGHGQLVTVVAEAGTGKSRLFH
jgi:hypothetical protein